MAFVSSSSDVAASSFPVIFLERSTRYRESTLRPNLGHLPACQTGCLTASTNLHTTIPRTSKTQSRVETLLPYHYTTPPLGLVADSTIIRSITSTKCPTQPAALSSSRARESPAHLANRQPPPRDIRPTSATLRRPRTSTAPANRLSAL